MDDTVFTLRDGEWRVRLNGRVLPTIWNTRGAALAGLEVERRREAKRQLIHLNQSYERMK